MEVYHCFGFSRPSDNRLAKVTWSMYNKIMITAIVRVIHFLSLNGVDQWMAYLKYKTLAFYAFYETERGELMPVLKGLEEDRPGCIFGGQAHKFVLGMKKKNFSLFLSFIVSINLAKTGLPRPVKHMLREAELKTAVHLTTEPGPLPEPSVLQQNGFGGTPAILSKETMIRELERTVEELFCDSVYTKDCHYEPFYPSTSSNYNRSRTGLGSVGELYFKYGEHNAGEFNWCEYNKFASKMSVIDTEVKDCTLLRPNSSLYGEEGRKENEILSQSNDESVGKAIFYDDQKLRNEWIEFMDSLFEDAYNEVPIVTPLGLAEACKVRVISKGPPLLYSLLKPMQKFTWSQLKTHNVFRLIGEPCKVEHISKVFPVVLDEEIIVNGDYKASTDNLHSWVSETLAKRMIQVLNRNAMLPQNSEAAFHIGVKHEEMIIRSLTGHFIEMPGTGILKPQKEGQLMGSITSFPFLCMANAAFCRWALELANGRRYRITNQPQPYKATIAPLLVNGDDCTLKGDRATLRKLWEDITAFGGLSSSVGKTLFSLQHRPVCVINSQTYDYVNNQWQDRGHLNLGLLLGYTRSTSKTADGSTLAKRPFERLGAVQRELKRVTPKVIWKEVSHRFIHYNREELTKFPNLQWDVPEYLGGAGLILDRPMDYRTRVSCSFLISQYNSSYYKISKMVPDDEWLLHKIVSKKLNSLGVEEKFFTKGKRGIVEPEVEGIKAEEIYDLFGDDFHIRDWEPPIVLEEEDLEMNFSKLYKGLTVQTLFENSLDDVYKLRVETPNANRSLVQNARVWKRVNVYLQNWNYAVPGLRVRTHEDILYEKKDSFIPTFANRRPELTAPLEVIEIEGKIAENVEGSLPFGTRQLLKRMLGHVPEQNLNIFKTAQELSKARRREKEFCEFTRSSLPVHELF